MAGGTGVYPFCDMIDLMFKTLIVSTGSPYREQIIKRDPLVVNSALLKNFRVTLYYSVHNSNEIIDVTAFQINHLCNTKTMKAFIKTTENKEMIRSKYPYIELIEGDFKEVIKRISPDMH